MRNIFSFEVIHKMISFQILSSELEFLYIEEPLETIVPFRKACNHSFRGLNLSLVCASQKAQAALLFNPWVAGRCEDTDSCLFPREQRSEVNATEKAGVLS